jgi:uncharacterized phage protein (TIGR02218 family)
VPATIAPPCAALLEQKTLRFAYLWAILRADGVLLFFTDHNAPLVFGGFTFYPGGFDASARRADGGLETHSLSLEGMIQSGDIAVADLRSGRYDEAQIFEYLVDWRYPWAGAIRTRTWWIDSVSFDGQRWSAETSGLVRFPQVPTGKLLARTCYWKLYENFGVSGKAGCKLDPAAFTFTPIAVAVVTDPRRIFTCDTGITGSLGADYFADGRVTWLTGPNAGVVSEVATHNDHAGGLYTVELYVETDFDIAVGNTFTITAGCDKLFSTCKAKFNNVVNFGGAPKKPRAGDLLKIAKTPQS